ncbi:ATP-binding protein [Megalodesulfovibrio paquesii]
MIKKIILHNFMAHSHSEITLAAGVTVLTGPNNTGKSAVVEALRCLSENPALGRAFIRHGARQATVAVELEDGTVLRWHRKKTTSWYEIDRPGRQEGEEPETFYKTGQGKAPPQVLELLQIQPVAIDDKNTVDVHLGDQRSPIFLIDRPPGQIAHFFAASSEGAHLLAMQDLLKAKVRDTKKERQTLQQQQEVERGLLDRLAPLPDIALTLEAAEAEESALAAQAAALPQLARRVQVLNGLRVRRARLQARGAALQALAAPPALEPVDRLARTLTRRVTLEQAQALTSRRRESLTPLLAPPALEPVRQLVRLTEMRRSLERRRRVQASRANVLQPLAGPPALQEVLRLRQLAQQLRGIGRALRAFTARREAVAALLPPPVLEDTLHPAALCRQLQALGRQRAVAARRAAALGEVQMAPVLAPVLPLAQLLATQVRLRLQREQLQARVQAAETALLACRETIATRLETLGHCPTCGQTLGRETVREFLEGSHGH